MFGRYSRAGGMGEICAGLTFPNFNASALRAIAATGLTGHNREGAVEVEAVIIPFGPRRFACWLCQRCGGVDSAEPREGLQKNDCPAVGASSEIYITIIREADAAARRLGLFEW